jgi:peptidoglycan hydrolase-like protein with peptidoglycan-binding domain
MAVGRLRLQLVAFALLSAGVAANVLVLQPKSLERLARRGAQLAALPGTFTGDTGSIGESSSSSASEIAAAVALPRDRSDITRAVQRELKARGYETGAVDGVVGSMTRAAVMAYEYDHGMTLTGAPTQPLLKTILLGTRSREPGSAKRAGGASAGQSAEAESVITGVQQSLAGLGYRPGPVNGQLTPETARAIREFEVDQTLAESGRISGPLVARLARLSSQGRVAAAP